MDTWGDTSILGSGNDLTTARAGGGQFNEGTNGTLDSIVFYIAAGNAKTVRVCIYEAATNDPDGSTLLEDLGTMSTNDFAWNTLNSTTNPTLTDGKWYFLGLKTNDATTFGRRGVATQDIVTLYTLGNESSDETNPWDDPCSNKTASLANSVSIYLNYTAASSGGGELLNMMNQPPGGMSTFRGGFQ